MMMANVTPIIEPPNATTKKETGGREKTKRRKTNEEMVKCMLKKAKEYMTATFNHRSSK